MRAFIYVFAIVAIFIGLFCMLIIADRDDDANNELLDSKFAESDFLKENLERKKTDIGEE